MRSEWETGRELQIWLAWILVFEKEGDDDELDDELDEKLDENLGELLDDELGSGD